MTLHQNPQEQSSGNNLIILEMAESISSDDNMMKFIVDNNTCQKT